MGSITLFARWSEDPDDHPNFQRLVDHYGPWVFSWAFKSVARRDAAEEIVQEVFLRMWRDRQQLVRATERSPRTWISTVTYHLMVDWQRDGWRRHVSLDQANGDSASLVNRLEAKFVDLDSYLQLAERCDLYLSAWETLAQSDLAASTVLCFLLRVRDNQSSDDIAARLQLNSRQAVNTNVRRVRNFLADEMGIPPQRSRLLDELDSIALESPKCASRLKEIAQRYGYSPDAGKTD